MTYTDIRNRIRSGDLLAYRGTGWDGWLVRQWTDSDYAHVGIAWLVGGRVLVLESYPGKGVRVMPASKRVPDAWVRVAGVWTCDAERMALEALGESYSLVDAIRAGLGLSMIDGGYQCAEYAIDVLTACQVPLRGCPPVPGVLVNTLAARTQLVEV